MTTLTSDPWLDIAREKQPSLSHIIKFGRNPDCDPAASTTVVPVGRDVWDLGIAGATAWVPPTTARLHAVASGDVTDVTSVGTLTFALNSSNGDTITIGSKVYTFETSLTNVDGNVLIGGSASASLDNLVAAINLAAGAGSTYAALMTANAAGTTARVGAGDTMLLYTDVATAIATTEVGAQSSWGAANTVVGVGAQTIRVYGLDASYVLQEETVALNGVDNVNTANTYTMIHRLEVLTAGTAGRNAGAIGATAATDGTVTASITIDMNQTLMAIYQVPSGKTGYITSWYGDIFRQGGAAKLCDVFLMSKKFGGVWRVRGAGPLETDAGPQFQRSYTPYKKMEAKEYVKVVADPSAVAQDIGAGFNMILVDN